MSRRKVFLIGIDGGDWQVLDPLIKAGYLKNIARFRDKYTSGVLNSTIPPVTAPAWSSVLTGVDPGKHGIFFWQSRWRENSSRRILTNRDIKVPQIPDVLSGRGVSIGMMNVPFSFPVRKVKGFMVSGMLNKEIDSRSCYPTENIDYLKSIDYQVDLSTETSEFNYSRYYRYYDKWQEIVRKRGEAFIHLYHKHNQPQFNFMVFVALDRILHGLMGLLVKGSSDYDRLSSNEQKLFDLIIDILEELDKQVGKIIELASKEDLVMIISDHGFAQTKAVVNINKHLFQEGFIKPKSKAYLTSLLWKLSKGFSLNELTKRKLKQSLGLTRGSVVKSHQTFVDFSDLVDTMQSAALAAQGGEFGIYLLDKSKREQVVESLAKLRNNEGKNIFKKVGSREDFLKGDQLEKFPEIMFLPNEGFEVAGLASYISELFREPKNDYRGWHRREGVYIINQPLDGNLVDLVDIAPSIYSFLGIDNRHLGG